MWSYLLLLNMGITFYFMFQEPVHRLIPGLGLLMMMIVLQIMAIRLVNGTKVILFVQLLLIIILGFVYHPMYIYLVFLLANFYKSLPARWLVTYTVIFAVSAVGMMIRGNYITNVQVWVNMFPPLFGGIVLPYVIRVSDQYREMAERLQAATKEVERLAQSEERQRIAQELHDTLGHTLSLLALKGEVVERMIERAPEKAASEARDIQQTATAALRRMRELVSDMKVVRLVDEWEHARSLCAAANIQLSIRDQLVSQGVSLTPLQESVIAMCLREALTNVVRHSRATSCQIEISADESGITCVIEDNGIGAGGSSVEMTGNGIVGMKQRLALLEGTLTARSGIGGTGVRLEMMIPIIRKQHGGAVQ